MKYNYPKTLKLLCLVVLVTLGCLCVCMFAWRGSKPNTLYQSDSILIVREGKITTVYDLVADTQHSFRSVRVKRSERIVAPYTSIDTSTLKVEMIPNGLRIFDKSEGKILTIQWKTLHNRG